MREDVVQEIRAVLERHDKYAYKGNMDAVAQDWAEAGFTPQEVAAWLEVGIWNKDIAIALRNAEVRPSGVDQAAQRLKELCHVDY